MIKFNYHSHSFFCDGKNTLEEMAISAIENKMQYFGFSAHSSLPSISNFGLQENEIKNYLDEINRLKEKYKDKIKLFASMEFDYIPSITKDIREKARLYNLDYIICSVHLVESKSGGYWFIDGSKQESYDEGLKEYFNGNIKEGVTAFFQQTISMIENVKPDIVGHFDKIKMHNRDRYFLETDSWYKDLVMATIEAMKKNNSICEVNTRGLYKGRSNDYYPLTAWLKIMAKENIRVTISTDAHKKEEVSSLFLECRNHIKDCGYKEVYYFDGAWKADKL
ncbi:MAG: histidinol-phosphatase [Bacteroidales bacterium]|jgi:histidinol-phosphatase (PHP family)|nr:histidinol-phosphatase [Bacteroidales bacterium]